MDIPADREYITGLLQDLVRINSVNPSLEAGGPGEAEIASHVSGVCEGLGLDVTTHASEPGRISVVGTRPGTGTGKSLMLNAHYDTVGVGGMADPFSAEIRNGMLLGRGGYDMKGALAACLGAVKMLNDNGIELHGDLLVAAVADEEHSSLGTSDVIAAHTVDGAIVTEPTQLNVCLAHKGFVWLDIETTGRAAHGSQFREGIDANMHMGRVLARLDRQQSKFAESPGHPLVGPPSLHAAMIRGGTAESIYAASCRLTVERRTIPGETVHQVIGEVEAILEKLKAEDPTFSATVRATVARESFEVSSEAPLVRIVTEQTQRVLGAMPQHVGENPWMDSALLAAAGVETVVLGPSGGGAHSDHEWVELDSVISLADILARSAMAYCGS